MLSSEASAEPGRWHTSRAPYLRGFMDAISDPFTEQVVFMKSAQIGGTEVLLNVLAFFIDQDPSPILCVLPTLPIAEAWSKDRLASMIRDTPRLREKVANARSRDSGNTLLHKKFPGGHLTAVGANAASGLASRPIRVVLADEVDRFEKSAGAEGDPVKLAVKRTATFWNRKIILVSTPALKGFSQIEKAFLQSDQRHFHVPCPHCGHLQQLVWAQLKWDNGDPATAHYVCVNCGVCIEEPEKLRMLEQGVWIAASPGSRIAGFHINALYSPWARWAELVQEFIDAQGDVQALKVFVMTVLGESWEEEGERVTPEGLRAHCHPYAAEVPAGVGLLVAAVDTQGDRLELKVKGFGVGEESWRIAHVQIWGDPGGDDGRVWEELDELLLRPWQHESGAVLYIQAVCIDTGGHHAEHVYRFAAARTHRRVWPIKGANQAGRPVWGRPGKLNKFGARLVTIGTDTAKDVIFSRMRAKPGMKGYMHFPPLPTPDPDNHRGYDRCDEEYLAQLTSEKVVTRFVKGRPKREYKKERPRNEGLDLEVYALAALTSLGRATVDALESYVLEINAEGERLRAEAPAVANSLAEDDGFATETPSTGWVHSWR